MGTFNFVFTAAAKSRPQIRESRQVQVEVPVTNSRPDTLRRTQRAVAGGGCAVVAGGAALVVAALVAPQGLTGGKALVADGALVDSPAAAGRGGRGDGRGGGGGVLVAAAAARGELAVAGFVASQGLVGSESLATNRALVNQLSRIRDRRRWWKAGVGLQRWSCGGGGGGAAASEHDEAESEVLFLGGVIMMAVNAAGTLGSLALRPGLEVVAGGGGGGGGVELKRRRRWSSGRVESFKRHC